MPPSSEVCGGGFALDRLQSRLSRVDRSRARRRCSWPVDVASNDESPFEIQSMSPSGEESSVSCCCCRRRRLSRSPSVRRRISINLWFSRLSLAAEDDDTPSSTAFDHRQSVNQLEETSSTLSQRDFKMTETIRKEKSWLCNSCQYFFL